MATARELSEAVTHVRLIHFTLILVCVIVLYIVMFAWSDVQLVRGELEMLRRIAEEMANQRLPTRWERDRVENHLRLLEHALGILTPIERMNQEQIDMAKAFDHDLLARDANEWPKPSETLTAWRTKVEKLNGLVIKEVKFDSQDLQWAKEKSIDKFFGPGGQLLNVVRIVRITPGANDEFELELLAESQHFVQGNPTTISSHETKKVTCNIRTERKPLTAKEWFSKDHPRLCTEKRWTTLGDKSIAEAIKLVDSELTDTLKTRKPTFVGMEFRGEDIGWVGPLTICGVLLYLYAFLQHINNRIRLNPHSQSASAGTFAEWVGAMPEWFPKALTWITVAALPAATASLAVYVVLGPSTWHFYGAPVILVSLLVCIGFAVLGCLCCLECNRLAKRYDQSPKPRAGL